MSVDRGLLGFLMSLWVEAETEEEAMKMLELRWGIGNNFEGKWGYFDTMVRLLLGFFYRVYTQRGPKKWGVYRVDVLGNGGWTTFRQPDKEIT